MEQEKINTCIAIVQQGERKGLQCQRDKTENNYCKYHQRNYEYDQLIKENKKLCGMFFRGCNNELSVNDVSNGYKNCETCRIKKSGKEYKCHHYTCTSKIKEADQKYCKKHIRNLLRENEIENSIKYCDIARGCFNKLTTDNKCDDCKHKEKSIVAVEITELRDKYNVSSTNTTNKYNNLHIKQENKTITVSELWRGTQRNAYSRGLLFSISEEDFEKIVIKPCYYCGFYSHTRLNGIDRIDNNKGYILHNCISCCKVCNIIKNSQHPNEFLDKISAICNYINNNIAITDELINKWDAYLSKTIRNKYNTYKSHSIEKRNIQFLLTEKEYNMLIKGSCYLCGIPTSNIHYNGIDRVNSAIRSYTFGNCKTCCGHCNLMKGAMVYSDFVDKCNEINAHKCDRTIFNNIPIYDNVKCRNEFYTADDIYNIMINGKYYKYIEWCQEKLKSTEFITSMNIICNTYDLSSDNKDIIVNKIKHELEKERTRAYSQMSINDKKLLHCSTLYSYLTQGKVDYFIEWYMQRYTKSTMFDEQLNKLISILPSIDKESGIDACKKFMYDEKNRRNIQQRRQSDKKVIKYTKCEIKNNIGINNNNKAAININSLQLSMDNITQIIDNNAIHINTIESKVKVIQETKESPVRIEDLKQWKVKQIREAIKSNLENTYKDHCEHHNDISKIPDWEMKWATFVLAVKNASAEDSEVLIRNFVEDLRRIRHNELCYNKNAKIIDREDRQQWPAATVVRAFQDDKLEPFKEYCEHHINVEPTDSNWHKRWELFIQKLEQNKDNIEELKKICSKFMTAQRTMKYRHTTKRK
jgi:hypothetical protein